MGFGRIFLPLLVFAVLEIMVISAVAGLIGWPLTLALVIATAVLGSALFRRQGLDTWLRLNRRVQAGEMPGKELVEGVMLLVGSLFLITPGFISDAVGLVLLIPYSRRALTNWMIRKGRIQAFTTVGGSGFRQGDVNAWPFRNGRGNVYEGESTGPADAGQPGRRTPLTLDGETLHGETSDGERRDGESTDSGDSPKHGSH